MSEDEPLLEQATKTVRETCRTGFSRNKGRLAIDERTPCGHDFGILSEGNQLSLYLPLLIG